MSDALGHRPKVAIIAPFPFPIDRGSPLRALSLATWLSENFDVHVITYHQGKTGAYPFRIHRTPWIPLTIKRAGPNLVKLLCDPMLLLKALWVILRHRIYLIDGQLHEGAFIGLLVRAILPGRKVLYNAHGTFVPELIQAGWLREDSMWIRLLAWFERLIERRVDGIVAQSSMRKEELVAKGVPAERIAVVEDAPDLDACRTEVVDRELERKLKPNGETIFLYVGGMAEYQGVDLILEAFRRLRKRRQDVRLVCFGRPADPYPDKARAMGISDSVTFDEEARFDTLGRYFRLCDVALAPRLFGRSRKSLEVYGGMPGVPTLLESIPMKVPMYMAGGMAIIASDTRGINSLLVHGETGWLVPPNDAESLESAMDTLASDSALRASLGLAARRAAETLYHPGRIRAAVMFAYQEMVGVQSDLQERSI